MNKRKPAELKTRITICKVLIKTFKEDPYFSRDPQTKLRTKDALKHYNAQLLKLEKELWTVEDPQSIEVGLQSGVITSKSPSVKE
jgi:hypothetical protein